MAYNQVMLSPQSLVIITGTAVSKFDNRPYKYAFAKLDDEIVNNSAFLDYLEEMGVRVYKARTKAKAV